MHRLKGGFCSWTELLNEEPVVHFHCSVGLQDGSNFVLDTICDRGHWVAREFQSAGSMNIINPSG